MTAAVATTAFQGFWPMPTPASGGSRVRGSSEPLEVPPGRQAVPTSGSCWGSSFAYGELASDRLMVTNLRLPGQYDERLLGSVGLQGPYYNWNRWYLPSMGRYLELDPIAKEGAFNTRFRPDWYGYAEGNPLRNEDPTGEGKLSCIKCFYYFAKCGPDIQKCRANQPDCDPEKGDMPNTLGGLSREVLKKCMKDSPCIEKMLEVCVGCNG